MGLGGCFCDRLRRTNAVAVAETGRPYLKDRRMRRVPAPRRDQNIRQGFCVRLQECCLEVERAACSLTAHCSSLMASQTIAASQGVLPHPYFTELSRRLQRNSFQLK